MCDHSFATQFAIEFQEQANKHYLRKSAEWIARVGVGVAGYRKQRRALMCQKIVPDAGTLILDPSRGERDEEHVEGQHREEGWSLVARLCLSP